ncbi:hypothetical protein [Streptomyces coelicoflavus]|uniref:MmyB family transcriptional regulator n=1 Tax=Streptomyces coelicoflavus TaxID=285562 RepID=UPI003AF3229F
MADLREGAGLDPDGPVLCRLVGEPTEHSPEFDRLWNAHGVRGKTRDAKNLHHPEVGALSLTHQAFDVRDAPGRQLVVHHAEPDSPSARALDLLGSPHAMRRRTAAGPRG